MAQLKIINIKYNEANYEKINWDRFIESSQTYINGYKVDRSILNIYAGCLDDKLVSAILYYPNADTINIIYFFTIQEERKKGYMEEILRSFIIKYKGKYKFDVQPTNEISLKLLKKLNLIDPIFTSPNDKL